MKQYSPMLILAILPDPAEEQYRKIKRFGDITHGVATQCVVSDRQYLGIVQEPMYHVALEQQSEEECQPKTG